MRVGDNMSILSKHFDGISVEYVKKGIFFRKPFYYISFDSYSNYSLSIIQKILMFVFTPKAYIRYKKFIANELYSDGVIYIPLFISPVYFRQNIFESFFKKRKNSNLSIDSILTKSYTHEYNEIAGCCEKEITKIIFTDNKKVKIDTSLKSNFHQSKECNFKYVDLYAKSFENEAIIYKLRNKENVRLGNYE